MLLHGARKLDADGIVDDFWMLLVGDTIATTGTGDSWQALAPSVAENARVDARGHWLTPGFIDLHAHGGGGASFDDGAEAIGMALAVHRAHGTTRSVLSLVTNPLDLLTENLRGIADLASRDPLILGAHLEGPFLSPLHRGAHEPHHLIEPEAASVEALLQASGGTLRQVTIAPELPGALGAIDRFVNAGVVVAVGHTDAGLDATREAFDHGATVLTHAFNAMRGIHHRAPGPVIAAFEDPRVALELILDGVHVHPEVVRLAFLAAPHRIVLVTDAMAAAGSADGRYRLGSLDVTVTNGEAMLSGTDTLAGSTLTQDAALANAIELAQVDPVLAVRAVTASPARALGLDERLGYLRPGFAADAVLLDDRWRATTVFANGLRLV
ncbi:N-acetylglucosamine-6-phosphate deacetylase [Agreia sp. VKM Ac-1783]|uniref:N-acetylglucosamine-6-phosphate deacetylase n=1 Tax=Agreia sp. VKM Ac-1783 TaxID=1938889 RepID=UPI000A2AB7F2|nr:N-acetylglucosamine-6-phosphate deacetylase [Agreia sp. VKM Ac-1783]SMQ71800.1 N-acetylglucosamine 6-phosphate deacetylase [Agreia sp. VKM Ac-1783]